MGPGQRRTDIAWPVRKVLDLGGVPIKVYTDDIDGQSIAQRPQNPYGFPASATAEEFLETNTSPEEQKEQMQTAAVNGLAAALKAVLKHQPISLDRLVNAAKKVVRDRPEPDLKRALAAVKQHKADGIDRLLAAAYEVVGRKR